MRSVFVLDLSGGREWIELVPNATELDWLPDKDTISAGPSAGDVIIFHEQGGIVEAAVKKLVVNGIWVVAVNQGGGDGRVVDNGFYRRVRGVGKPIDNHFKACFSHFLKRLSETGRPEWELLEGPPPPDALLSYHLLGLLPDDPEAKKAREQVRPEALIEARTIAEAKEDTAFMDADIDDREKLRELLV